MVATCWDRDVYGVNYLGETRINIIDILEKSVNSINGSNVNLSESKSNVIKIDPKWFKLYSSQAHHTFVNGTIQLGFQLYGRKKKGLKAILSKSKHHKPESGIESDSYYSLHTDLAYIKRPASPIVPSTTLSSATATATTTATAAAAAATATATSAAAASPPVSSHSIASSANVSENPLSTNEIVNKWNTWSQNLIYRETIRPNDQGFYPEIELDTAINKTYNVQYPVGGISRDTINDENDNNAHLDADTSPEPESHPFAVANPISLDKQDVSDFSDLSDVSSMASGYSSESNMSLDNAGTSTTNINTNTVTNATSGSRVGLYETHPGSESSNHLLRGAPHSAAAAGKKSSRKKHKRINKIQKSAYQFSAFREVKGVLFVEIISASGLPPFKNFTRTGFDMDPFVVVSFGKKTFRTSWRKHTLNPVFNERLAFEVLNSEVGYDMQFSILDKDNFTFHDSVASLSISVEDIINMSLNFIDPNTNATAAAATENDKNSSSNNNNSNSNNETSNSNSSSESVSQLPSEMPSRIDLSEEAEAAAKRKAVRSGLLRKKIKPQKLLSPDQEEKFVKYELPLEISDRSKYKDKYEPVLKIKARFEPYEKLRQEFWRHLLKSYDVNDDNQFSDLELSAFFDFLGSTLSEQTIKNFFGKYNKNPDSDSLNVEEVITCLEELIQKKDKIKYAKAYGDSALSLSSSAKQQAAAAEVDGDIIKIDQCPVCGKSRLSKKDDLDIITHVAVCVSKDWSSVDRLITSAYVSPSYATKRWYSKVLIQLGYGKVGLGKNNANILVQDRTTGIIVEEKMITYVRIGIRLLYRGTSAVQKKQAKRLLKNMSIKRGKYDDSSKSKKDIPPFIKYFKIDMNECIKSNANDYATFNEFFYRQLKPNARPVEALDNPKIITSAADCRCTAFNNIKLATEIWIKGSGFTITKLFANKHPQLLPKFANDCSVCIFRLAPQDYHRFHSPVDGVIGKPQFIDGQYYTVNPMAIRSQLDVFGENVRCILPIETTTFGTVVVVPVGAMMVGSTVLTVQEGQEVKKGDELGYFKFGGSTLLLLFQPNRVYFDSDLVDNSNSGIETLVKVGTSVGHAVDEDELAREKRKFDQEPEHVKLKIIRTITGGGAMADASLKDYGKLAWEAANLKFGWGEDKDLD